MIIIEHPTLWNMLALMIMNNLIIIIKYIFLSSHFFVWKTLIESSRHCEGSHKGKFTSLYINDDTFLQKILCVMFTFVCPIETENSSGLCIEGLHNKYN